jgi:RNA polymerase sigma-70 factor (ECF subfamily)
MSIVADPIQAVSAEPGRRLAEVLAAAARGDGPAWRELIELYSPRVFALARSRCGSADAAEEVTQSVFATVAAKLGGDHGAGAYVEMGRFEPWLFRIAMNRIRDEARRRERQAPATDPADLAKVQGPKSADRSAADAELGRLRLAVGLLPDADREVIELRHHGGLSFRQIADLVNEPIGTLLARHHRALRKLRAILSEGGKDDEP